MFVKDLNSVRLNGGVEIEYRN